MGYLQKENKTEFHQICQGCYSRNPKFNALTGLARPFDRVPVCSWACFHQWIQRVIKGTRDRIRRDKNELEHMEKLEHEVEKLRAEAIKEG